MTQPQVTPIPKQQPASKKPRRGLKRGWMKRGQVRVRRTINGEKSAAWHRSRQWCFDRAKGRCEPHVSPDCTGRAEHAHHMRLRSQGGSDGVENLLAVCHACHGWIHANPAEAADRGWIVRRSA